MYKIEKDFSMPPLVGKYPFTEMEIGDSFLVETDKERVRAMAATSYVIKKYKEMRFKSRKQEKGYRIWRVE